MRPDKSRIVDLGEGAQGFDFLGFHHRMVMSRKYGRRFCQPWPSRRAMASLRAKVKAIVGPRNRLKRSMHDIVEELNPVLRGWGNYFRWGNSTRVFTQIDSYFHQRLALFDSKKRGRRGPRWANEHNYAWFKGLGVHSLAGSIRWQLAATAVT